MRTILSLIIAAAITMAAETPKQPKPLSDKAAKDAALAMATMERTYREYTAIQTAAETAKTKAQEAYKTFQDLQAKLKTESGAPDGCRLDEATMNWIRDVQNPGQAAAKVACEIEPAKPAEVKK